MKSTQLSNRHSFLPLQIVVMNCVMMTTERGVTANGLGSEPLEKPQGSFFKFCQQTSSLTFSLRKTHNNCPSGFYTTVFCANFCSKRAKNCDYKPQNKLLLLLETTHCSSHPIEANLCALLPLQRALCLLLAVHNVVVALQQFATLVTGGSFDVLHACCFMVCVCVFAVASSVREVSVLVVMRTFAGTSQNSLDLTFLCFADKRTLDLVPL